MHGAAVRLALRRRRYLRTHRYQYQDAKVLAVFTATDSLRKQTAEDTHVARYYSYHAYPGDVLLRVLWKRSGVFARVYHKKWRESHRRPLGLHDARAVVWDQLHLFVWEGICGKGWGRVVRSRGKRGGRENIDRERERKGLR
jgi:hypothetical protein